MRPLGAITSTQRVNSRQTPTLSPSRARRSPGDQAGRGAGQQQQGRQERAPVARARPPGDDVDRPGRPASAAEHHDDTAHR